MDNQLLQAILDEQKCAREKAETTALLVQSIDTKLGTLVGPDGTNGEFGSLKERVNGLERFRWLFSGAVMLAGMLFGVVKWLFPRH